MRTACLRDSRAKQNVWMSHGDRVERLPAGFATVARSGNSPCAAVADEARGLYGLQFHPEVVHTRHGFALLQQFRALDLRLRGGLDGGQFHPGVR